MNIAKLWSFFVSLARRCLAIPSREVKLFVFSDEWNEASVRIVNSGAFPITLLRLVAENKMREEILEEWRNLILGTGEKKEIFLNLREKIFSEICRLYIISAENKKFYLGKKELEKIRQAASAFQHKNIY